jgi:hypothetical protein
MDKQKLINFFISKLGNPQNREKLEEYINFCLTNNNDFEGYFERHHILPRAVFPEHIKDVWNISNLTYENHVLSHFILAEAYLDRKFSRTLNFLKNKSEDDIIRFKKILSETTKKYWKDLSNEEYDARCLMYSVRMKKMMHAGSEFHKKVCAGVNEYYENNPDRRKELSIFFKDLWKNKTKEEYDEWCKNMIWSEDRHVVHKKHMAERWANPIWREELTKKMNIINKDINKRQDASEKLKELWKDPEFVFKMKNRKTGTSNSLKMKEKWKDPVWKKNMLHSRKLARKLKNETKQNK